MENKEDKLTDLAEDKPRVALIYALAVGITVLAGVVSILWFALQKSYSDNDAIKIQAQLREDTFRAREDTIRAEAKREAAQLYKKAFEDNEARVTNLEEIVKKLLSKSSSVDTKSNKLQTQIDAVSGTQKKIEHFIPPKR